MKKLRIIIISLGLFMLVGCNNNASDQNNNSENDDVTNAIEETQEEQLDETQELELGELVLKDSLTMSAVISVDEEKVQKAVEMGYPSPDTAIDTYEYGPLESDVIQYSSQESSFELGESLTHQGFKSLEVVYEKIQYSWNDFFDELDVSEYKRELIVDLKGNSIFEADIVDENEKYYRYYDENKGLYYEVQDLMLGNYLEEDAELTNVKTGQVSNYKAIENLTAPTYNPLILQHGEEVLSYFITALDDKPCVYIESLLNDRLYKRWVDIEFGLVVKELVFSNEGLLESERKATSVVEVEIPEDKFKEPSDIDFQDITLFVYSFTDGDVESLVVAVESIIPAEQETGILLTTEQDATVTIYTAGLVEMTLDDPIYYFEHTLDSGEVRTIRNIQDDRFYTVCDEMEIVQIYDKSCYEQKFFDFEDVGLLNVEITDNGINYSFYDPNNISVSGLFDVYEYVIEGETLKEINCYSIENINDNDPLGDVVSYKVSLIDYDESMYNDDCLNDYEIIDYGEGSFDDGENRPFWFE